MYADRIFNAMDRVDPERGMLLIAAPGMNAGDFTRSVVLLLEHSEASTLGVILTNRSDVAVYNVLPSWLPAVAKPQALYAGGPVNPQAVMGVGVTKNGVDIESVSFFNRLANRLVHVDLRADPTEVAELVDGIRLFAGYAEWAPGQLNEEIERGDWYVAPALPADVIAPASQDLWSDVMRRQAMPLPLLSTFPMHVEDN